MAPRDCGRMFLTAVRLSCVHSTNTNASIRVQLSASAKHAAQGPYDASQKAPVATATPGAISATRPSEAFLGASLSQRTQIGVGKRATGEQIVQSLGNSRSRNTMVRQTVLTRRGLATGTKSMTCLPPIRSANRCQGVGFEPVDTTGRPLPEMPSACDPGRPRSLLQKRLQGRAKTASRHKSRSWPECGEDVLRRWAPRSRRCRASDLSNCVQAGSDPLAQLSSKCLLGAHRDSWQVTPRRTPRFVYDVASKPAFTSIPGPSPGGHQTPCEAPTGKLRR
jgi:hypothetical protein